MLVPIWILATGVLLLGLFNQPVLNGIVQYAIQPEGS
jgi:hypothetical protein